MPTQLVFDFDIPFTPYAENDLHKLMDDYLFDGFKKQRADALKLNQKAVAAFNKDPSGSVMLFLPVRDVPYNDGANHADGSIISSISGGFLALNITPVEKNKPTLPLGFRGRQVLHIDAYRIARTENAVQLMFFYRGLHRPANKNDFRDTSNPVSTRVLVLNFVWNKDLLTIDFETSFEKVLSQSKIHTLRLKQVSKMHDLGWHRHVLDHWANTGPYSPKNIWHSDSKFEWRNGSPLHPLFNNRITQRVCKNFVNPFPELLRTALEGFFSVNGKDINTLPEEEKELMDQHWECYLFRDMFTRENFEKFLHCGDLNSMTAPLCGLTVPQVPWSTDSLERLHHKSLKDALLEVSPWLERNYTDWSFGKTLNFLKCQTADPDIYRRLGPNYMHHGSLNTVGLYAHQKIGYNLVQGLSFYSIYEKLFPHALNDVDTEWPHEAIAQRQFLVAGSTTYQIGSITNPNDHPSWHRLFSSLIDIQDRYSLTKIRRLFHESMSTSTTATLNTYIDTGRMLANFITLAENGRGGIRWEDIDWNNLRTIEELHNALSRHAARLRVPFIPLDNKAYLPLLELDDEELCIPDTSFKIVIPQSSHEISEWGAEQRHCLGSYSQHINNPNQIYLGVRDTDSDKWLGHMQLMLSHNPVQWRVNQFYGSRNSAIPEPTRGKVLNYILKCIKEYDAKKTAKEAIAAM